MNKDAASEPDDLGYKLILSNGHLLDSWLERRDLASPTTSQPEGQTCDTPSNSYVSPVALLDAPAGKRIDYILYAPGSG